MEWAASAIIAVLPERYPVKALPAAKPISAARPSLKIFSPSFAWRWWWWWSWSWSWWEWPKCHLFGILYMSLSRKIKQGSNWWKLSGWEAEGSTSVWVREASLAMQVLYMGLRWLNLNPIMFGVTRRDFGKKQLSLRRWSSASGRRWARDTKRRTYKATWFANVSAPSWKIFLIQFILLWC